MLGMCPYYRWQRRYFEELVKAKLIVMLVEDLDEEEDGEVNSKQARGIVQSNDMEAQLRKLVKTMQLLIVMIVVLVGVGVMYLSK